jgi:hypothetical protein
MTPEIGKILLRFCHQRAEFLLEKISKIAGTDVRRSKDRMETMCRAIVAYQLLQEGYSTGKISQALGKDRSTIKWYEKEVETMLINPRDHEEIMYVYRRFNERRYDIYYRSNQRAVTMGGCVPDSSQIGLCQRCNTEKRREDLRDLEVSDRNKHDLELKLFTLYQGSSQAGGHKVFRR